MTFLGETLNDNEYKKVIRDQMIFGTGCALQIDRKKWNPLYWALGKQKIKHIPSEKLIIEKIPESVDGYGQSPMMWALPWIKRMRNKNVS